MEYLLSLMRCGIGVFLLTYASYTDLKTRTVKNWVWVVMGVLGSLLLLSQLIMDGKSIIYYSVFIPIAVFFGAALVEHDPLIDMDRHKINFKVLFIYSVAALVLIYQSIMYYGELYFIHLIGVPVMILLFHLFYQMNIIHGGADAKALMGVAILTPWYPRFSIFPLIELGSSGAMEIMEASFPFALLVLMNSVFFVVWIFIGYLLFNATRGDLKLPMALLGYRMDIEKVKDKHVWLMENVEDGRVSIVLFPKKENKDDVEALKELGKEKVWVTPKIPFMVPMTVGFIGSVVLGNIFLGILILLG